MRRFFTELMDAFAPADGPPPRTLWPFLRWALRGSGPVIGVAALLGLFLGVSEAFGAWLVGYLVDLVASESSDGFVDRHLWTLAGAALFFMALRPLMMGVTSAVNSLGVMPNTSTLAMVRLNRHTLGQSLRFFEEDFAGRIAQKQMQTVSAISNILNELVNSATYALSVLIGAALLLSQVSGWLGLLLGGWFVVYALYIRALLPRIRKRSRARAAARAALSGHVVDTVSNIATVKLFAHATRERDTAEDAMARLRERMQDFGVVSVQFRLGLGVLAGALPVMLLGAGIWLWQGGQATPGDLAMAGLLATRIGQMSFWLSFVAMGVFTNIGEIEDGMRTLTPPHDLLDRADAAAPERVAGAVAFENVEFRYGRREGGGLDGLSLRVAAGEKVGLVGRSGAGKSTALELLLRLRDVEAGRITLDGGDIRELTQDGLRDAIATVRQDTSMFNRSARDNIAYGRPDATDAEVTAAAQAAQAHEFVMALHDHDGRTGYDARLGERGVKLSGGQRQRVAIARAFLKDAPILLLDEATAALDSETEQAVQAALETLMEGRTVIAVAHRLSTLARMDRIVVIDEGRVVEEGRHDVLLARGGLYASFWARQSGGFLQADAAE
ncbi:ABC transporter ATP-binding protein [Pontivivens ytuae]|uniref:ABC transporter ATP-binding protein n=1 Tax=Pontivivens ytuae TaxID=2789856 RepID=A0A7S9LUE1_9RHOB|nr:ABC transporter ATP-binding protein [Pontivivens ytuae]QPH55309.1 ABC transporter ATP-binding protein [Pontivivens ytuae]